MEDTISRQAAIYELKNMYHAAEKWLEEASDDVIMARAESCMASLIEMKQRIEKLLSAQPEIIRCKDCMHNGSYDTDCPIDWNGKEYCSFAERITDE